MNFNINERTFKYLPIFSEAIKLLVKFYFILFFLIGSLFVVLSWPHIQRDPPDSATQVLKQKTCSTNPAIEALVTSCDKMCSKFNYMTSQKPLD